MNTFVVISIIIVLLVCLPIIVSYLKNKHESFGLYADTSLLGTPIFTPNSFSTQNNKITESTEKKAELLKKWLLWFSQIPDETVRDGIYAFCPNLQPVETISNYGYTERMSSSLERILPMIEDIDPKSLKTNEDIQRVFKECIKIGVEDVGALIDWKFQPELKDLNYVI